MNDGALVVADGSFCLKPVTTSTSSDALAGREWEGG